MHQVLTRPLLAVVALAVLASTPATFRLASDTDNAAAVSVTAARTARRATTAEPTTPSTTVAPTTTTALPPPTTSAPVPPTTVAPAPAAPRPPAPALAARAVATAAPRPGPDRAPGWEARLGAQAMALIRYPVDSIGFQISFLPGRAGRLGVTYLIERRIEIYVRTTDTVQTVARTVGHELGHAVDTVYGNAARRQRYKELRGIPATEPWYGCDGCTDYATPAGDYAEVFAYWLLGPGPFLSRMAPAPPFDQLVALVPLFNAP